MWATKVKDCSFVGAALRESALSTGDQAGVCRWEDVDFDRADLRGSHFLGGQILRCSFRDAKLDEVNFLQTDIDGVLFSGEVRGVLFDQRVIASIRPTSKVIKNADFSGAVFDNSEFLGCRFENVSWPDGIMVVPYFRLVVARVMSYLVGNDSVEARLARAALAGWVKAPGVADSPDVAPDSTGIVNLADLSTYGSEDAAVLLEKLIRRAREELALPVLGHPHPDGRDIGTGEVSAR